MLTGAYWHISASSHNDFSSKIKELNLNISLNHPNPSYDDKKGVIFWLIGVSINEEGATLKVLWL
jgi:hypothetical protein